jgi:hypothetical protein
VSSVAETSSLRQPGINVSIFRALYELVLVLKNRVINTYVGVEV